MTQLSIRQARWLVFVAVLLVGDFSSSLLFRLQSSPASATLAFTFCQTAKITRTRRRQALSSLSLSLSSSFSLSLLQACNTDTDDKESSNRRRHLFASLTAGVVTVVSPTTIVLPKNPAPVHAASLLEEFGTDPSSKIEQQQQQQQQRRAEKTASPTPTATESTTPRTSSGMVEINPSLRASYYYPTAKKRYLPRIQKVSNEIQACSDALHIGDWETVTAFRNTAENAILPLQLYVSSLDGQGLSMSTQFSKQMKRDAVQYQAAFGRFDAAVKQRNVNTALDAVTEMAMAVADYRQQGRLKDDDGNIPSIDEMKRMTMRRPTVAIASSFN